MYVLTFSQVLVSLDPVSEIVHMSFNLAFNIITIISGNYEGLDGGGGSGIHYSLKI